MFCTLVSHVIFFIHIDCINYQINSARTWSSPMFLLPLSLAIRWSPRHDQCSLGTPRHTRLTARHVHPHDSASPTPCWHHPRAARCDATRCLALDTQVRALSCCFGGGVVLAQRNGIEMCELFVGHGHGIHTTSSGCDQDSRRTAHVYCDLKSGDIPWDCVIMLCVYIDTSYVCSVYLI